MPTPIIDLQRRLALVGAIRAGGEKQPSRPGAKLETWRLTSPRQQLVEQAAELYGGQVTPWEGPNGPEYQVYTEAAELPVLVMPGYSLRQTYELWEGATKRMRLCDGLDEELSGRPCLCNAEGVDPPDLYTRAVVALPELDTILGWRLITKGLNAGHELPTIMALVEGKAGGQAFVPARLRLDQRRGVKDGQVVRYVVPTFDLDAGYLALAQPQTPQRQLSAAEALTPAARRALPSVEQALDSVASAPPPRTGGRQAAEMGPPTGAPHTGAPPVPDAPQEQPWEEGRKVLDVLVGKLRREGHITTAQVYESIAGLRHTSAEQLAHAVNGTDAVDGSWHWAALRDALTRPEREQLTRWLRVKEDRVRDGTRATAAPQGEPEQLAYGQFPADF